MRQGVAILLFGPVWCQFAAMLAQSSATEAPVLRAESATSREVSLTWGGAGKESRLERRAGAGTWTKVATTTESRFTDSVIVPFATYSYRVIQGTKFTNIITVGPPPGGFHTIAPRPDKHPDTAFGRFISPVLDSNGDPAAAFVFADPNGDGRFDDTQLMFVAWDRAGYRWQDPVSVATLGQFDPRPPAPCVSVARDAKTGTYGITWVDSGNKLAHLALSTDGGATWHAKTVFADSRAIAGPSLVLSGGMAHLSLEQDGRNAILYLTGALDQDPASWNSTLAPMLAGTNAVSRASSLALDSDGAPALTYWQRLSNGTNWTLVYWRPGSGSPAKVTDTGASNYPPDGVVLQFAGKQPRIVLDSRLDRAQPSSHYSLYSNDGGATWSKPVAIPDDGNQHLSGYMSFAVFKDGRAAFAGDVGGGNTNGMKCSWPKLARSPDLSAWNTCAPQGAQYPQVRTLWG
ncbi:MAG: sialidase family protein, partial [Acidobacteria bacterium]|nr:sialidase family protein [Acidobacteriota bacterium]